MRLLGFANARVYHCHSYGIIFKSLLNHAVEVYFGGTAMSQLQPDISSLLKEDRVFTPSSSFSAGAHIKSREDYDRIYKRSIEDPEGFCQRSPASFTGSGSGTGFWNGTSHSPNGSSEGGSTSRTIASTGISRRGARTKPRLFGRANRVTRALLPTSNCIRKSASLRMR